MADVYQGELTWTKGKGGLRPLVKGPAKKGGTQDYFPAPDELSFDLTNDRKHETDVDFEIVRGEAVRVRPRGGTWYAGPSDFFNPYNFVPALDPVMTGPLAQGAPAGHDRLHPELYSGRIRLGIEVITPLLLPDASRCSPENSSKHSSFPLVLDADGRPSIRPTSFKGALRAAYEAVTNSRLSSFYDHGVRLGRRRTTRERAEAPPNQFLPKVLQPAGTLDDLSPADRVFGWVRQNEGDGEAGPGGAWQGQLRIRSIVCRSSVAEAIETFPDPGLPLAILSTPKPEQARFYLGDRVGASQGDGLAKLKAAYCMPDAKRLRGRKVYPHHAGLPDDYWNGQEAFWKLVAEPGEAQSIGGRFREYLRVSDDPGRNLQDEQNRSILGWVKPGTRFEADIEVTNLREAELGALLWLASLPDGYLRLGGGKPLGFGSVRLSISTVDLFDGAAAADRWRRLAVGTGGGGAGCRLQEPAAPIATFRSAIAAAYGGDFDRVPFIAAYRAAAVGHVGPVHYPRAGASEPGLGIRPSGKGENFKWFLANERSNKPMCLPDLAAQRGLSALEDTKPEN